MGGRAFVYYYDTYMKDKNADVEKFAFFCPKDIIFTGNSKTTRYNTFKTIIEEGLEKDALFFVSQQNPNKQMQETIDLANYYL